MRDTRLGQAPVKTESGFSLLELVIVVAVAMIVMAVAVPLIGNATKQYRLTEAGTDYANLLQQARMRAIQDDKYYTVLTAQDSTTGWYYAYIDLQGSGSYSSPDPMITFAQGVVPQTFSSGPALSNLESQFLPSGAYAQGTVATTATGPTFGPRGLPCVAQTSGGYTTCTSLNSPTSFITFIQSDMTTIWEAITVTPASRIREWSCWDSTTWNARN